MIRELKEAGAKWVQLDEPILVLDLEASKLEAFKKAYSFLGADLGGVKLLLETYFADIPAAAYKWVISNVNCFSIGYKYAAHLGSVAILVGFFCSPRN